MLAIGTDACVTSPPLGCISIIADDETDTFTSVLTALINSRASGRSHKAVVAVRFVMDGNVDHKSDSNLVSIERCGSADGG